MRASFHPFIPTGAAKSSNRGSNRCKPKRYRGNDEQGDDSNKPHLGRKDTSPIVNLNQQFSSKRNKHPAPAEAHPCNLALAPDRAGVEDYSPYSPNCRRRRRRPRPRQSICGIRSRDDPARMERPARRDRPARQELRDCQDLRQTQSRDDQAEKGRPAAPPPPIAPPNREPASAGRIAAINPTKAVPAKSTILIERPEDMHMCSFKAQDTSIRIARSQPVKQFITMVHDNGARDRQIFQFFDRPFLGWSVGQGPLHVVRILRIFRSHTPHGESAQGRNRPADPFRRPNRR
jgi:hypothetical protein